MNGRQCYGAEMDGFRWKEYISDSPSKLFVSLSNRINTSLTGQACKLGQYLAWEFITRLANRGKLTLLLSIAVHKCFSPDSFDQFHSSVKLLSGDRTNVLKLFPDSLPFYRKTGEAPWWICPGKLRRAARTGAEPLRRLLQTQPVGWSVYNYDCEIY